MGRVIFQEGLSGRKKSVREDRGGKKETGIEMRKTKMEREYKPGREKRRRETEIDKDRAGERTGDGEATGVRMTWIHTTSIDYWRMKSRERALQRD